MVRQVLGWPEPGWGRNWGNSSAAFSPSTCPDTPATRCVPSPGQRQASVDMPVSWYVIGVGLGYKNILEEG